MKKIKLLLIPVICIMLCIAAVASGTADTVYIEYPEEEITVIFADTTDDYYDLKDIADKLVYGTNENIQTRAWCWLLGHDLTTRRVTVITHKVAPTAPRCLNEIYDATTCENCDYYVDEIVSRSYIFCCPEE